MWFPQKSLFFKLFTFKCEGVCMHVCVCAPYMGCVWVPAEARSYHGARDEDSCEQPGMGAGNLTRFLEGQQVLLSWWSHTTYGAEVSFLSLLTSACSWETEFSLDCLHSDLSILPATFPKVHRLVTFSHASHHPSAFQSRLLFYIIQCFCILTWLPHENLPKLISKTGQARVKHVALRLPFTKYWALWLYRMECSFLTLKKLLLLIHRLPYNSPYNSRQSHWWS